MFREPQDFPGVNGSLAAWPHLSRLSFAAQTTGPGFQFTDVTSQAGIRFEHNSGAFGGKFLPETLGSGCAFLDYDAMDGKTSC